MAGVLEDENGNVAKDPRDADTTLGESSLFCLTASALNRKSSSGNDLGIASCGEEAKGAGMQRTFRRAARPSKSLLCGRPEVGGWVKLASGAGRQPT